MERATKMPAKKRAKPGIPTLLVEILKLGTSRMGPYLTSQKPIL
jgi:hypothetical protein